MEVIEALRSLSISNPHSMHDDDFFIDRLHHRYTVALMVMFAIFVTTNQYAGEPITCW
jgi:hypothetical protein